jgi:hypothetical protein
MQMKPLPMMLLSLNLVAQVTPVTFSKSKDVVSAFSSSGVISLPSVSIQLDLSYPHGKKDRRSLSVVYDPQSRYYFWHISAGPATSVKGDFADLTKSQKEALYADSTGIFAFLLTSDLWVKAHTSQADGLDAAESTSIDQIQQGLSALEAGYRPRTGPSMPAWPWDYKPIDVGTVLSVDFSCSPLRASCQDTLNTIVSVGKQGNHWRLVLRNRWDVEVILDQNFNLVSARQLTQPKQ